MAHNFADFPTGDDILGLSTTALAERLLLDLTGDRLDRKDFLSDVTRHYRHEAVAVAFAKAWDTLVYRRFLVKSLHPDWYFLSGDGEVEKKRIRLSGLHPRGQRVVADRWIVEGPLGVGGKALHHSLATIRR